MINSYTRSYKAEGPKVNTIECEVYYSKGGMNYFTGRNEPRGYYFSIQPLLIEDNGSWTARSFSAFSGAKDIVLPCQRQSKKRYEEAKAMMDDLIERYLATFCENNGITITSNEYDESERER